jgi:glycosyltransferase involved in cell wall biosynthesis
MRKVIFFAKVKAEYLSKWEYYNNDVLMLQRCYDEVIVCNSYLEAFWVMVCNRSADLFCWWWHSSLPIILLAKFFRARIFCTGAIHMFDCSGAPDFYTRSFIYRLANLLSLRLADFNIFISNDQLLSITSHIKTQNPVLLYSSLPPKPEIIETLYYKSPHRNSITFLYFSWLTLDQVSRKGLLPVLEAFSDFVKDHDCDARLIISGKSADALKFINARIQHLNIISNVDFRLDVTHENKIELYSNSDLLLAPSYMEGFGNATLEAMACGCPSLVSAYGASKEVVGETGFIINLIDSKSILEKLVAYSRMNYKQREQMRIAAWSRASVNFNFENRLKLFQPLTVLDQ